MKHLVFAQPGTLEWQQAPGMSLVRGYPMHALFNVPFAVALGIPLARVRST